MAITNKMIIEAEAARLAAAGEIKTYKIMDDTGAAHYIPEALHTFAAWHALGYQVKRGEKAKTKISIWKYKTTKDAETGEEASKLFMQRAAFFTREQCEKITDPNGAPA